MLWASSAASASTAAAAAVLLLLASATAASAAAAAAAAAAALLLVGPARCFFFLPTLSCESCTSMMDVVRTLRKVPGTNTNNMRKKCTW